MSKTWQAMRSACHSSDTLCKSLRDSPLLEWFAASFTSRIILVVMRRVVMDISTLGIDLSKTTFHVMGFNV